MDSPILPSPQPSEPPPPPQESPISPTPQANEPPPPPIFYSQCAEDKFLYKHYFENVKKGVYIELGALDGVQFTNTKFFEDHLGWTGILIEPHQLKFEALKKNRPNNYLFNELVSNSEEQLLYKYFLDHWAGVSGIKSTLPSVHINEFFYYRLPKGEIMLKPRSLTSIIKSTPFTHIDLLSLDVEGHEYEVLLSWDFSIPIDVILIETLDASADERKKLCRDLLIEKGYRFEFKCGLNEVFAYNFSN